MHPPNCCCFTKVSCYCSVAKSYATLNNLMDCRMPGFPVLPYLSKFAQIHVHQVGWCYLTISSSAASFSFCLWSFPTPGYFPITRLLTSGGQSIGALASASVLLVNIQYWFPLGLTNFISLQSKGLLRVFSSTQFESTNSIAFSLLYGPTLISEHDYWKKP